MLLISKLLGFIEVAGHGMSMKVSDWCDIFVRAIAFDGRDVWLLLVRYIYEQY